MRVSSSLLLQSLHDFLQLPQPPSVLRLTLPLYSLQVLPA